MSQRFAEVSQKITELMESEREARAAIEKQRSQEMLDDFIRKIMPTISDRHLPSYEKFGESNIVPILFMDIVGYSRLKLDDDQKRAVELLNEFVKQALEETGYDLDDVVCLPTGDGMCLCFSTGTDGPLMVGARVQALLAQQKVAKQKRPIRVRMGIHSGNVLRITDLKGGYNLAGAAINISQRAMNCGDEGHILCTMDAYKIFRGMKDYRKTLKPIKEPFIVKHDARLRLYNYFREEEGFGNCNEPIR